MPGVWTCRSGRISGLRPLRRPSGSKILINQRLDRLAHEHVDSARMGCILAKQRAIPIRRWTDETRRPKILSRTDAWSHATRGTSVPRRPDTKPPEGSRHAASPSAPEDEGRGSLGASPRVAGGSDGDHHLRHVGHPQLRNVSATCRLDGAADELGRQRRPQSGRHDLSRAERHDEILRGHSLARTDA